MLMHFVDFRIKWKFRFRLIPTVLGLLVMCLFVNALQDEDFQTDNYLYPFLFYTCIYDKGEWNGGDLCDGS